MAVCSDSHSATLPDDVHDVRSIFAPEGASEWFFHHLPTQFLAELYHSPRSDFEINHETRAFFN